MHITSLSRKCPVNVLAVELGEERVEGRQGVLGELRGGLLFHFRRELGEVRAEGRGPALGSGFRIGVEGSGEGRYVAHGEAEGGYFGEFLAGDWGAGDGGGGHGAAEGLEGAVDLAHAAALARVGGLPAVLAERLRRAARARLAGPRGARTQLVLVVLGHGVRCARGRPTRRCRPRPNSA